MCKIYRLACVRGVSDIHLPSSASNQTPHPFNCSPIYQIRPAFTDKMCSFHVISMLGVNLRMLSLLCYCPFLHFPCSIKSFLLLKWKTCRKESKFIINGAHNAVMQFNVQPRAALFLNAVTKAVGASVMESGGAASK
jgi:hypothetical protein